jgi:hypothetical protein
MEKIKGEFIKNLIFPHEQNRPKKENQLKLGLVMHIVVSTFHVHSYKYVHFTRS